jgi:hypothetical protein
MSHLSGVSFNTKQMNQQTAVKASKEIGNCATLRGCLANYSYHAASGLSKVLPSSTVNWLTSFVHFHRLLNAQFPGFYECNQSMQQNHEHITEQQLSTRSPCLHRRYLGLSSKSQCTMWVHEILVPSSHLQLILQIVLLSSVADCSTRQKC